MLQVDALNTEYASASGSPVKAAQDVTFSVPEGKLFTLLGPSGCGKTTTLRSIAGLERPVSGTIAVGGRIMFSSAHNIFVPPNQRNFGMVFQSYAVWPHMTVRQNVAYPLKARGMAKSEQDKAIKEALDLVEGEPLPRAPLGVLEAPLHAGGEEPEAHLLERGGRRRDLGDDVAALASLLDHLGHTGQSDHIENNPHVDDIRLDSAGFPQRSFLRRRVA